jgi:uncharacterized iron-regulated protein
MKSIILVMFLVFTVSTVSAQDKPAYKLFNSKGKEVKWSKMVKQLEGADMVFFGELHDNPIAHWLEYELLTDLYKLHDSSLVIGAEMIESDNQAALDEYLAGRYDDKKFAEEARLWKNYNTDYKPLVDFAKDHRLPFIATNVPRRFASAVFKGDFAALDSVKQEDIKWIAPLPILFDINVPCYADMLKMGNEHPEMKIDEKYPKAQALKDATMAYFIMKNKKEGGVFYHINGSYHSDNFEGIIWHLKKADPSLKIMSLTAVEQDDIKKVANENLGKASYIIVIPVSMSKSY